MRLQRRSSDTPSADFVSTLDNMDAIQLGHYCGKQLPGPQLSEERSSAMRVVFSSDAVGINTGFRAKYEFIDKKPVSKRTLSSLVFITCISLSVPLLQHCIGQIIRSPV